MNAGFELDPHLISLGSQWSVHGQLHQDSVHMHIACMFSHQPLKMLATKPVPNIVTVLNT